MTKTVGLIGYPLGHSISPVFQQAAFDHLGLNIRYEIWETEPEKLEAAVKGILAEDKIGSNVTVPYKEDVIQFLDEINEVASDIGAVNTIVKMDNRLIGYNTDAEGFLRSLEMEGKFDPEGKKVAIIGAGGAARAVGFALAGVGVDSLMICNRSVKRAEKLAERLNIREVAVVSTDEDLHFREAILQADLVVNCTSVGMKHGSAQDQSPVPYDFISPFSLVYDVVYNPVKTPLIQSAEKAGARTLSGLSMLVYQGVASFELWMGQAAPVDIMMRKAENAL